MGHINDELGLHAICDGYLHQSPFIPSFNIGRDEIKRAQHVSKIMSRKYHSRDTIRQRIRHSYRDQDMVLHFRCVVELTNG